MSNFFKYQVVDDVVNEIVLKTNDFDEANNKAQNIDGYIITNNKVIKDYTTGW